MSTIRGLKWLVSVALIATLGLPAVAGAAQVFSYQGDDYSYNSEDNYRVIICDEESDDRGVYANFHIYNSNTNPYRVDDTSGSSGGCGESGNYLSEIYKHHPCESIPSEADPCGPYVYPYGP